MFKEDTIAAITTGMSNAGVGIIRISGDRACEITDMLFRAANKNKKAVNMKSYTAAFGGVYEDDRMIDEAILLVMKAPHTYTCEDVCELQCHGGIVVLRKILDLVIKCGARTAEPGEFTKRAFLNGKMDLTRAESVMNIISAKSEQAKSAALNTLDGALYKKISEISLSLKKIAAQMAAWVDYPDEEIDDLSDEKLKTTLLTAKAELEKLIKSFDVGQIIIEGVETAIVGKPNVGKSTLMNLLSGCEKSIVTSVAGTTRDIVEETVTLGNNVLRLADTAGLHDTEDTVEKIGVDRTRQKLDRASLVLAVFDSSTEIDDEDMEIIKMCNGKNAVAIINKTDLNTNFNAEKINKNFESVVYLSAKDRNGIQELEKAIEKTLGTADFDTSAATLMNERQLACCKAALQSIDEAISALEIGMTRDALNVNIDVAVESLDTLTGEKATESVVNEIFSQFCVGK